MLLEDIHEIFTGLESDRITSETLVEKLVALEERPWCEWKRGQPMTQNSLAKLLDAFNIKSATFRFDNFVRRGYEQQFFDDAFTRYLPPAPEPEIKCNNATTASDKAISPNQSATRNDDVALEKARKPLPHNDCSDVALQKGGGLEETLGGITIRETDESGVVHYEFVDETEDERS